MIKISKVKLSKKGIESLLSPLETDVLKILWQRKSSKVRSIYNHLKKKRKIALTSVAVTLDRLYKKGLVDRKTETGKGGVHYVYYIKFSRPEFEKHVLSNIVDKLIETFGSSAISYFHERFSKRKKK